MNGNFCSRFGVSDNVVIDLSRLVAGFCPEIFQTAELRTNFLKALFKACDWGLAVSGANKVRDTNLLLALRTLVNLIQADVVPFDEVSVLKPRGLSGDTDEK